METKQILVEGIVQGVGFRPFVYRIATEASLNGYVRNLGNVGQDKQHRNKGLEGRR